MLTSDRRSSGRKPRLVASAFWLCLFLDPLTLPAENFLLSFSGPNLYAVDPYDGSTQLVGSNGLSWDPPALVNGLDGLLYAAAWTGGSYSLFVIDPETVETTLIGPLDIGSNFSYLGLASDDLGRLWLMDGGNAVNSNATLYQVDPASGAVTSVATYDRLISSLAARGDELFAFTQDSSDQKRVELIDLETFELTPLFDLDIEDWFTIGASFDARGRLWILTMGGGILTVVSLGFWEVDLATGEAVQTFWNAYHFGDPLAGMFNLAHRGPSLPPTEVPALDGTGLTFFVVLLLGGGLVLLWRRRSRAMC